MNEQRRRKMKTIEDVDLIVVGGGPAGLSAAVNAAELGLDVVLIEKNGFLGGANVAGMSGTIGGLYSSHDDKNTQLEQIVKGFAGRFVDELDRQGGIVRQVRFGHTALSPHDTFIWKETADAMIKSSGVKVYYHTVFTETIMQGEEIEGIIVENKSGKAIMKAKRFIDASGDGDLAYESGVPCNYGDNGRIQAMTMVFRMENVDWDKAGEYTLEEIWDVLEKVNKENKYNLPRKHPFIFPCPKDRQALMNCTAIVAEDKQNLYPTEADDLTYAEIAGREQVREYERFFKENIKGFENAYILDTGAQIGIRQSRSIQGEYTLKNDDVVSGRKFDTAIARSAWPIEVHGGKDGVKIFNLDDDYYEIPFEVLIPKRVKNLLVAGRCISAEHEALASSRVVAQCFEEGMAAGIAMVQSIEKSIMPSDISVKKLQDEMRKRGALI